MNVLYKLSIAQAGIKIARRNIINLKHADDNTLMAESNCSYLMVEPTWNEGILRQPQ